jgi:hypothetical protein
MARVGTIGFLIGRDRTFAEREGSRRGLANGETMPMPVSAAWSVGGAEAKQRSEQRLQNGQEDGRRHQIGVPPVRALW